MRYVNGSLTAGESVVAGPIHSTKWEYLSLFAVLFWTALLAIVVLGDDGITLGIALAAFLPMVRTWLRRWSTEYAITTKRLVTKVGLLARSGDELRLARIESVQIAQSLPDWPSAHS